jgi:hypothetical protein
MNNEHSMPLGATSGYKSSYLYGHASKDAPWRDVGGGVLQHKTERTAQIVRSVAKGNAWTSVSKKAAK